MFIYTEIILDKDLIITIFDDILNFFYNNKIIYLKNLYYKNALENLNIFNLDFFKKGDCYKFLDEQKFFKDRVFILNKDIEKQKNNNDINEENKLKEIKSAFYKFRIECLRTLINNNDSQKTINTKFVKEGLIEILQKYDEKINTNDTNLKYIRTI